MPTIDGVFVPRRWNRLRGNLFDVQPPVDGAASEEDTRRYRRLRRAVADVVLYIVGNVGRRYEAYAGPAFDRKTALVLRNRCKSIAAEFFAGELSGSRVETQISRMVKMFGLVVYSTEDGPRRNWPMSGGELTMVDALGIVDRALRGVWPDTVPLPPEYVDERTGSVVRGHGPDPRGTPGTS